MNVDDSTLKEILITKFKRPEFRAGQLDIVKASFTAQDILVVLPTGHGKSLTFQLPALFENSIGKFYVVISPLLALMKDQVMQLQNQGIEAATINSTTSKKDKQQIFAQFSSGKGSLLYISPEQCLSTGFLQYLTSRSHQIKRIVIDEAHCAVEWGSDFRKDYARLGSEFRPKFKGIPFTALTGTASLEMQRQIKNVLGLIDPVVFSGSSRRPHLHYEVRYLEDPTEKLVDLLQFLKMYKSRIAKLNKQGGGSVPAERTHSGVDLSSGSTPFAGCGIVYCRSRALTELVAQEINRELGECACAYHAGLDTSEREETMLRWMSGDPTRSIVIATIAFGLGIDKPDTRFVVHFDMPNNIEAYAQQTGRGGRDRKAARCILYFSASEAQKCIRFASSVEGKRSAVALVQFAKGTMRCRHDVLGNYFGDRSLGRCNYACDYCKMPRRLQQRYDTWVNSLED